MGTGQAPFSLWWLAALAFVLLLWALSQPASRLRAAFWRGWIGGVGYFTATHFWIVDPFLVDPVRHGWMAPFAVLGIAGGMSLIWGTATLLAHWLAGEQRRIALALVPSFMLAEFFRAYALTGFPWSPIGSFWLETPVAQLAALGGVHGLTFLSLGLVAAMMAVSGRARVVAFVALALLVGGAWFWGAQRQAGGPQPTDHLVRIVQPNAPQHLKWHPDHMIRFFERALDLTAEEGAAGRAPDLVVWPETSVPALLDRAGAFVAEMSDAARGAPLIFGVQRNEGLLYYNSLAALTDEGLQVYDKRHLVPFGEYVPFGDALGRLGITHLASAQGYGYAPGPWEQPLLDLGELGQGLPLICYEGIFPHDLRGFEGRADWSVLVTNDAWFGQLTMPYMHLDHARMRAIETGLPMIRAANTGISAMIDAQGAVTARLGLGETGYIDAILPGARPATPYARWGDWPLFGVALLSLFAAFLTRGPRAAALRD
ncbi:apolipoprotein N-acyltransferase [Roseovarius sp. SCSIO 43702]|nr:apolipoprotein N-acyltransferase [Roseovarius sp. SCSIO 43702]